MVVLVNYRVWPERVYQLSADSAKGSPRYLHQLRQTQKAGHGQLPSLRQRLGRAGTDPAGLESRHCERSEAILTTSFSPHPCGGGHCEEALRLPRSASPRSQ